MFFSVRHLWKIYIAKYTWSQGTEKNDSECLFSQKTDSPCSFCFLEHSGGFFSLYNYLVASIYKRFSYRFGGLVWQLGFRLGLDSIVLLVRCTYAFHIDFCPDVCIKYFTFAIMIIYYLFCFWLGYWS